ncbi:MAG TPA: helix-turn-helix domain-containing GNAT family N-acetyltransferase [Candidatus Acidoferrales bacterium]|nr:helix-turn-helix domain-containing GNAT family N-acetyltransferase [Candidatus Acidoferrales bacterium]
MQPAVERVRRFNRFYTRTIGALRSHYLDSPFSLTENRVLFELAHRDGLVASDLVRELGLDAGYVSRMLKNFAARGLVRRKRAREDARRSVLTLSAKGRATFAPIERRQIDEVAALLQPLAGPDRERVTAAMATIEELLCNEASLDARDYTLRVGWNPGDLGWVIAQHGSFYATAFGWDRTFEGHTAGVCAKFARDFDPERERCWFAERDGERLGCVFVVKRTEATAQLRMLMVDAKARGLGIGSRLVDECITFARARGYKKMMLWTVSILKPAIRIYEAAGFKLVKSTPNHEFGVDLVDQIWELRLH